jgi:hypothetical protein
MSRQLWWNCPQCKGSWPVSDVDEDRCPPEDPVLCPRCRLFKAEFSLGEVVRIPDEGYSWGVVTDLDQIMLTPTDLEDDGLDGVWGGPLTGGYEVATLAPVFTGGPVPGDEYQCEVMCLLPGDPKVRRMLCVELMVMRSYTHGEIRHLTTGETEAMESRRQEVMDMEIEWPDLVKGTE